ncbi:MAG: hypothetical protein ACI83W_000357 [Marinoscillum sp.]|jgi:hypothetical protein
MKNLKNKFLTLATVASMVFLFSCGDEDVETPAPALPTISVSTTVNGTAATSPLTVYPGDSVGFSVAITAAGGFDSYIIYQSVDGGTATRLVTYTRLDLDVPVGTASVSDGVGTIVEASSVGSTITFDFEVVDDASQTSETASVEMIVEAFGIVEHTQTMLYGQSNASGGSFYNAIEDMVYNVSTAFQTSNQSKVDFVFWYGGTSLYAIGAVSDASAILAFNSATSPVNLENLTVKNATQFKALTTTAAEFDAVSNETELLNEYGEVAASESNVVGLSVDDVFAFVLSADRDSKVGLAKVVATSGMSGADRTITIMVKIQE